MTQEESKGKELIETGAKIVGGATGGVVGFLFGGPIGAAAGGATGVLVSKATAAVVNDISGRVMSYLEQRRVATAAYRTVESVRAKVESGETPRKDEAFVGCGEDGRSAAQQIFEGVLQRCKNEYEEKKQRFIENIFINITFRPDVSPQAAYSLLSLIDRLTYRQICLLALIGRAFEFNLDQNSVRFQLQSSSQQHLQAMFLKQELADLDRMGFFDDQRGDATAYLSGMGRIAFELLGLSDVPFEDVREVRSDLP
jgi:hypothetical protein